MQDSVFRMYDIRGKVGSELNIEQVYDATRAIAYYFTQHKQHVKKIAVAMDGRTHSPAIKKEVCRALQDSGMDVVFIGVCPSPLLYFALHVMDVDAGIVVTASHNPKEYNGLKLCLGKDSLWGADIAAIRDLFKARHYLASDTTGSYVEHPIVPDYISYITQQFPHLHGMSLPVVMDCGNGATGAVIPELIRAFNWSHVRVLYPEVDGDYPNHEADPVVEQNMADVKHVLATTDCVVGIGFDGDGDRMAAMTKKGVLVPGDQMLALFSREYIAQHPGGSIVCDIKSSSGLLEIVKEWGGKAWLSPSGHSIIKRNMYEHKAGIGGELSGHFCFKDRFFGYDDGIYAALRLLEIMMNSHQALSDLLAFFPHKISSPEFRIDCVEEQKWTIVQQVRADLEKRSDVDLVTIDGVRATLAKGMGVLRASNTQPVLSLRFESDTQEGLKNIKQEFVVIMSPYFDSVTLQRELNI